MVTELGGNPGKVIDSQASFCLPGSPGDSCSEENGRDVPLDTGVQGEDTEQWHLSWDLLGSQLQICTWFCCAEGVVYVLSNPLSPSLPLWRATFFIKDLCSLKSINAKLEWRVCKGRVSWGSISYVAVRAERIISTLSGCDTTFLTFSGWGRWAPAGHVGTFYQGRLHRRILNCQVSLEVLSHTLSLVTAVEPSFWYVLF